MSLCLVPSLSLSASQSPGQRDLRRSCMLPRANVRWLEIPNCAREFKRTKRKHIGKCLGKHPSERVNTFALGVHGKYCVVAGDIYTMFVRGNGEATTAPSEKF